MTTACRWCRESVLPVPARKAGRLILVSPGTAAGPSRGAGPAGTRGCPAMTTGPAWTGRSRLPGWAAQAGLPVVRVEAEVGSGMNGARARARLLLAGPAAGVVVVRHRDRREG